MKLNLYIKTCFLAVFFIGSGFLPACQSGQPSTKKNVAEGVSSELNKSPVKKASVKILSPKVNQSFHIGDIIPLHLTKKPDGILIDSFRLFVDNHYVGVLLNSEDQFDISTKELKPGPRQISASAVYKGQQLARSSVRIVLLSDIEPHQYSYEVVKVYPHDPKAYTQGLVYEDGFLYEGTGLKGKSSLRKIRLNNGEPVASLNLPPDLFGEGICILKDHIIQLTWTSGLGFVYDKNSFRFLHKIRYATQGWGLTTNGESLIMSDGSNKLYFIEPTYFTETSRIEVYDKRGPVSNLNELEYINGKVYANIYQTDKIAIIDPETGKVDAYINLTGLLEKKDRNPDTDVLNGIAWDATGHRLFVTGKNWPKLFEIRIK